MKLPSVQKLKDVFGSFSAKFESLWGMLNKLSGRERKLAIATATVVFFLVLNFGIVQPIRNNIKNLNRKILLQEKKVMENLSSGSQKSQVDSIYLRLTQEMDAAKADDEEIRSGMLHDIEEAARANGIYLSEVKPQVSSEGETFKAFNIRMQAEGRAEQLTKFFSDLVKTKKLYYVETLRITPHPDDVNKVKATISLVRAVVQTGELSAPAPQTPPAAS